jgi:phage terminase large subunit GpA-like protein
MNEEICTLACPVLGCAKLVTFAKGKEWSMQCPHCGEDLLVQTQELGRYRLTAEEPKRQL